MQCPRLGTTRNDRRGKQEIRFSQRNCHVCSLPPPILYSTVREDNGVGRKRLRAYPTSRPRCILSYLVLSQSLRREAYRDFRRGFAFQIPLVLTLRNQVRLTTAIEARKLLYIEKVLYGMGALIEVQHHSTSPARRPVQAGMQSTVHHPNDDTASIKSKGTGKHCKGPAILGRHPQEKLAR